MKTYIIERKIPDAGKLTQEQLQGISKKSNEVLGRLGPRIKWLHSYITDHKVYCVYGAENEELVKIHAEESGFRADSVGEISTKIDSNTAD